MTDHIRSETARRRREHAAVLDTPAEAYIVPPPDDETIERDDTLVLLFMCCHPALSPASAIALMLRAVGGLTTAEIARAFLVPEATMAQRISRAKQSIRSSGVRFAMPSTGSEGDERLRAVLHALYLIFNEGYTSSGGAELQRIDLAREAIRLARAVHRQLPAHGDVAGLLALMLLTDARREARTGPGGELIPLHEQDRTRWNRDLIQEGVALVTRTMSSGSVGPYQLQAAIAAVHDEAAHAADTDWPQILALYDVLAEIAGSPIVELNRAVAVAMAHGPLKGLEIVDAIESEGRLTGHHRVDAVRAHLLEMAGQPELAVRHYLAAAERTTNIPERNYLMTRAAELRDATKATDRPLPRDQ
jgi:predicted RNA polymerase sigma factor